MLNNRSLLITGGTGFLAREIVSTVMKRFSGVKIVIFSRDEYKHAEMQEDPNYRREGIKFVLGDIRDLDRVKWALQDIDFVIHAAALKNVPMGEENPTEYIKTNIGGTKNVITAAQLRKVKKLIAISTDKAVNPVSLYGSTKLCADKLISSANNDGNKTISSVVRLGNIWGSRGSVVPTFLRKRKDGNLPITHPQMTRFSITARQASECVLTSLGQAIGGEIFIPRHLSAYRLIDLAKAIGPECEYSITGARPGDKMHETLISRDEADRVLENESSFIIIPDSNECDSYLSYSSYSKTFPNGLSSDQLPDFMSLEELQYLLAERQEDPLVTV